MPNFLTKIKFYIDDFRRNFWKDARAGLTGKLIEAAVIIGIPALFAGIVIVIIKGWAYLNSLPTNYQTFLAGGLFCFIAFTVFRPAIKKLWKMYSERRRLSEETIKVTPDSLEGTSKKTKLTGDSNSSHKDALNILGSGYLISGFLDMDCVLSHEVGKKVEEIVRDRRSPIIPTKYLFAHADSYGFYNKLRRVSSYTIKRTENLFGEESNKLANCLANLVKEKSNLHIVSLGIGGGRKESALIQALGNKQINLSMLAIDINPSFIYDSLHYLREDVREHSIDIKINFIIGDFDRINNFELCAPNNTPILFLALGGVFGNQNEQGLLENLRGCCEGDKYLLIDFQTKEPLSEEDVAGYNSQINKKFILHTIKSFCKDDSINLEDIEAVKYSDLTDLNRSIKNLSSVEGSETIVMVGNSPNGQKHYVGYSTRYDRDLLKQFFEDNKCNVIEMFSLPDVPHTSLLLCKI